MGDEARIREIFKRFDKDGSGEISARELVEVLRETDRIQNPGRDEGERDNIVKKKAGVCRVCACVCARMFVCASAINYID